MVWMTIGPPRNITVLTAPNTLNAGIRIIEEAPLGEISANHVDRMCAVNARGAMYGIREALPIFQTARIINILSELRYLGRANGSIYGATKAAFWALTHSADRELAPGILVNAVGPGPTDTRPQI